ncbi:MAG: NPCBM/NEW2 domain-containing protein [Phycisphaerae bacterium]
MSLTEAPPRAARLLAFVEGVAVFLLGVVVMNYFYAASVARPGAEIGVPEHDSYYHVAMAAMLPEHGLLAKFPWLQYTYFRDQGDDFVSHHWGFHLLLLPFVTAAQWLVGDALPGGRWAMSAVFGANLLLFHLLLRNRRVPLHWLWIALFLLLPDQFFARHGFVRAIGASFLFMQLTLLALFARRYVLAGLALAAYVHLYLGAVFYGPLIVAFYALAQVLAPRAERVWPWKMVLLTASGWFVGVATYPYSAGMFEFLQMQVFGSGLSPDIEVGREWKPYSDPWFIVMMAAPLLVTWVIALLMRLRNGHRLDARETALLLLQFAFLLLTLKARRFIEYWPPLCLLSAAYLAAPPLEAARAALANWWSQRSAAVRTLVCGASLSALVAGGAAAFGLLFSHSATLGLAAEWRAWLFAAALLTLPALIRAARVADGESAESPLPRIGAVVIGGVVLAAAFAMTGLLLERAGALPPVRLRIPGLAWGLLAGVYGLIPIAAHALRRAHVATVPPPIDAARLAAAPGWFAPALVVALTAALSAGTLVAGARTFASASRQVACYYDLREIRDVSSFLQEHSQPGDIIFTDDWDIFPVLFYHNRHNHYIVGLDPKFTHQRDPELWDRYVKVSRGEVPSTIRVASNAKPAVQKTVALADIRDHFKARYVICDRDHRRLADRLANAPDFADFVYPGDSYRAARNAEYVVFRIRAPDQPLVAQVASATEASSDMQLATRRPISIEQGWGELGADRTVDGNVLRLGGKSFRSGIGTHAPARLTYEIPRGARYFEATIGIDDETGGHGSAAVSIRLDGELAYESPLLVGGQRPVVVRLLLRNARQIELAADPTRDGQRFDHVDFADARFIFTDEPPAPRTASQPKPADVDATAKAAP